MKYAITTIFVALVILCSGGTVFSQTRLGCSLPATFDNRGTYYMSCFNRVSGETDDYGRINYAVNYVASGKIIFDQNSYGSTYTVSNTVVLHSNLILEGTSAGTTIVPTSSAIKLTASGTSTTPKAIFRIDEGVYDIAIRDLGLFTDNTVTSYTAGILAQNSTTTSNITSAHFEFNHLKFTGFTTGINVNATNANQDWQFDNVKLEHSIFEDCQTGVHINSYNSGWRINSIEFFTKGGEIGLYMERGTYTTIDSMIGNRTGSTASLTFIKIGGMAAAVTIRNCISEGFTNDLIVDSPGNNDPLTLTANTFQGVVDIKNADVVSTGNFFGATTRDSHGVLIYQAPQPVAHGTTRITSIGDAFCNSSETNCATGGWAPVYNGTTDFAYIQFSSDVNKNLINRPTFSVHKLDITTDLVYEPSTPLLNLNRPTYNGYPLLRLGTGTHYYTLMRDGDGFLNFQSSDSLPYKGYNFDGVVKLPEFTASTLPTILENGSMVYCSNCQAGTTPCAAGTGGGALAISIPGSPSSKWSCK